MAYNVNTKESIVDIGGKRYRKIEYKTDIYYLRLLTPEMTNAELEFACNDNKPLNMEKQIFISTSITKRSSVFIEGLKKTCSQIANGKARVEIDPDIQIGFLLKETDDKAIFKNKKIFWAPGSKMLGVGGEW